MVEMEENTIKEMNLRNHECEKIKMGIYSIIGEMRSHEHNKIRGLHIVGIDRRDWLEFHISGIVIPEEFANESEYSLFYEHLHTCDGAHIRLFGGDERFLKKIRSTVSNEAVVVDRFVPPSAISVPWVGVNAFIVKAKKSANFYLKHYNRNARGWIIETNGVRMGYLTHVASTLSDSQEAYMETFEETIRNLDAMGFAPGDLTRTWCYFRDIIRDYHTFNDVRKRIFTRHGILNGMLPASTGVQGIIESGEHLLMNALAFSGTALQRHAVSNPLQCDATEYGSLFSRAVLINVTGLKQLFVSGLASIGKNGETLFPHDPKAQVNATVDNASALLSSCGLGWSNVVSGTVYIHPDYVPVIKERMSRTVLEDLPFCHAIADICRTDLLFEIEFMAFSEK